MNMADDPATATIWVDVSHHDRLRRGAPLDWAAIREATSPIMCARATYGDPAGWNRTSSYFGEFQKGAAAAGFECRGGYHNLARGDAASMRRQVDWLRRELDTYGCTWGMADIERYAELLSADMWPRYDDVLRFRDAWVAVEDRVMMWYIPRWVWSYWGSSADLRVLPGPLIQSHYLDGIYGSPRQIYDAGGGNNGTGWDDFYGGRYPQAWQFSATCTCPGASDRTDVNAFRGSAGQLIAALTGGEDMTPEEHQMLSELYAGRQVAPWQYKNDDGIAQFAKTNPGEWYPDMHAVVWDTYRRVQALEGKLAAGGLTAAEVAAELAKLIPAPPTAEQVADVLAARLRD